MIEYTEFNDVLPAGLYYVGDLCYISDNWDEMIEIMYGDGDFSKCGVFWNKEGEKFANYTTAYGDGIYEDEDGGGYAVDSGTIGLYPIKDESEADRLGQAIYFPEPFTCDYDEETGVIRYGDVYIHTGFEDDEEEEEDE